MGRTLHELGHTMTAAEFGLHAALEAEEPMPAAQLQALGALLAAIANGDLQAPEPGRIWRAADFVARRWQLAAPASPPAPQTLEQIMAAARAAGLT